MVREVRQARAWRTGCHLITRINGFLAASALSAAAYSSRVHTLKEQLLISKDVSPGVSVRGNIFSDNSYLPDLVITISVPSL